MRPRPRFGYQPASNDLREFIEACADILVKDGYLHKDRRDSWVEETYQKCSSQNTREQRTELIRDRIILQLWRTKIGDVDGDEDAMPS